MKVDRLLINSLRPTGANTTIVASDLVDKRQNMDIVQVPPKQIGNQIYWFKEIITSNLATSSTTYTESNTYWTLGGLTDSSTITALFDQYCIYSVVTSVSVDGNSPVGVSCSLLTAIDYDNVSNIGPSGIIQYNSCTETLIGPSTSLVRYVKPCVALAAYTGSFTGFTTSRTWLNSSSSSVQHYGLRLIALQCASVFNLRVVTEVVVGLRNKF
jgi:hypothetical protein